MKRVLPALQSSAAATCSTCSAWRRRPAWCWDWTTAPPSSKTSGCCCCWSAASSSSSTGSEDSGPPKNKLGSSTNPGNRGARNETSSVGFSERSAFVSKVFNSFQTKDGTRNFQFEPILKTRKFEAVQINILVETYWMIRRQNTCLNMWPLLMFRLGKASSASLMLYVEAFNSTPSPETWQKPL